MESSHKNNLSLKYKSYCNLISTLLKDSKQWYFTYFFKSNNNDLKKGLNLLHRWKVKVIMTHQHQSSVKEVLLQILFLSTMSLMTFSQKLFKKCNLRQSFLAFFFFFSFFPDFVPLNIHDSIILSQIAEDETSKFISSLNSSKSTGSNSISTKTLKLLQGQTSKHFITTGVFPNSLKSAKVIPIH